MKLKNFLSLPIFSVFFVMGFVYYITVFILIEDWVGLQTSAGSLNSMIFTTLVCLCVLSFLVGVLTDPGRVPSSYIPDVEDTSFASDQEPKKNVLQSKYCDKCAAYKPPRTHHCRVCKRCILRMLACGLMMLALSVTLGTLLGWHIYLITHNMTTIEYYEGIRAAWLAKKSGLSYRHPFDISVYKNITLVLGPNTLRWFCPTSMSHLKDGVSFPTLRDSS
ncbi:hypothetical protein ERO13_D10G212000v2 [Gossypium hirsutum]|uniref:S-acyltransferase n=1 Tax=Gossypium barbadense TaxID=3634 RepID=A0A5J5PUT2_GOSBA|nr:hypothetical protein ES319_D10G238600v1 [Gossypium barbadense]KAG4127370.1 hypothetical protein ERO13_D10G212000v2 [Gossypium hirsutum]